MFSDSQIVDLNNMRDIIEGMPKFRQVEVLRILSKNNDITLNENKYGVHINLTDLSLSMISELNEYIKYVNVQEVNLNELEKQKEDYKNYFFSKDNKDNLVKNITNAETVE
jgi:hypothetical protein